MTKRTNGPQPIGSVIGDDLVDRVQKIRERSNQRRIEDEARPGESWADAAARLRKQQEAEQARPNIRKPPAADCQPDFFVPALYDVGTRDSRTVMDVAVFRLSKRDKRAGEVIRHDLPDGYIEVKAGPDGMASVWDYDMVIMMVSHMTEAMNRYRDGQGDKPGRVWRPHMSDILKFCRRGAFAEDALSEADALAAVDDERQEEGPAFLDDEGPANDLPLPPYRTQSLPQILAALPDDELASWPGELADQERERRRVRALTPGELAELRQDMTEASAWMRAELARRRIEKGQP